MSELWSNETDVEIIGQYLVLWFYKTRTCHFCNQSIELIVVERKQTYKVECWMLMFIFSVRLEIGNNGRVGLIPILLLR